LAGSRGGGGVRPALCRPFCSWLSVDAVEAWPLEDLGVRFSMARRNTVLLGPRRLKRWRCGAAIQGITFRASPIVSRSAEATWALLIRGPQFPAFFSNFYPLGNKPWIQPFPILGICSGGRNSEPAKFPFRRWVLIAPAPSRGWCRGWCFWLGGSIVLPREDHPFGPLTSNCFTNNEIAIRETYALPTRRTAFGPTVRAIPALPVSPGNRADGHQQAIRPIHHCRPSNK